MMARPAKFTTDEVLDAASMAVLERGRNATVADVGRVLQAPSGSIYHRFESREELFATLWIRSIHRFHQGLLIAYESDPPEDAVGNAARHIPLFCRSHPADALALTLYRQPMLASDGPSRLRAQVSGINDAIGAAELRLVTRRYGRRTRRREDLMRTAVRLCPYGLVRPYLGGAVPLWLDDVVVTSARAIAALGDPSA